jgi:hypothetical protein
VFGLSKQGYYQRIKREIKRAERDQYIINEVQEIRKASAILTYFSVLGLIGLIGYSEVQADVG